MQCVVCVCAYFVVKQKKRQNENGCVYIVGPSLVYQLLKWANSPKIYFFLFFFFSCHPKTRNEGKKCIYFYANRISTMLLRLPQQQMCELLLPIGAANKHNGMKTFIIYQLLCGDRSAIASKVQIVLARPS